MKNYKLMALLMPLLFCLACGEQSTTEALEETYAYAVSVELMTDKTNAPALQSFAHAANGSQWLLFAGRTNQDLDDGGLHDLNGDYAASSFVPWSFNENILVYDIVKDELAGGMPFDDMVSKVQTLKKGSALVSKLKSYETVFRNSNPLVTQEGDYVYLVGGYGTPIDSTQSSAAYQTFGQVARIHVPSVISLVTEANPTSIDWDNIFAFGQNDTLKSTGAEVFKIGDTFYAAGGHNFGSSAPKPEEQKYLDAVYPFTLTKTDSFSLEVGIKTAISDVKPEDIGKQSSDNVSKFRRRDGPVVSALFNNNGSISEGLTFYGGVFQPDSVVEENGKKVTYFNAWNSALYIHPGYQASNTSQPSPYYTIDPAYYQANTNVYACADFEVYDASNGGHVITYLIGGIGDGTRQSPGTLSPFTNSLMEIHFNMTTGTSKKHVDATNVFGTDYFYGAESLLIPNNDGSVKYFSLNGEPTELVDGAATFPNASGAVTVGYVYGGIEAFTATPGTYGPTKSAASNKIWKVTLNKVGL